MTSPTDRKKVAAACRQVLAAGPSCLDDEYFYNSVPLCVIDSVYSIGVRYEGVRNVIDRFCTRFDVRKFRPDRNELPEPSGQFATTALVKLIREAGATHFAEEVFQNRQRTSSRSGILKAEAVLLFADVIQKHGGEHLQDIPALVGDADFERDIKSIPGQGSGLSLDYFYMLAGSEEQIKADRMILRFLLNALGRDVSAQEALDLLTTACGDLVGEFPDLTPRLLDHCIWHAQRAGEGA